MDEEKILSQDTLLTTREFRMVEDGVKYKYKRVGEYVEHVIPFEDIGDSIAKRRTSNEGLFFLTCVFYGITLILLLINPPVYSNNDIEGIAFWGIVGSVFLILYLFSRKNYIYLTGGRVNLEFFENKPDSEEVTIFINDLIDLRKQFLKKKYTKIDVDLPIEPQLSSIKYLKDSKIISEDEFNHLKNKLVRNNNDYKRSLGFSIEPSQNTVSEI